MSKLKLCGSLAAGILQCGCQVRFAQDLVRNQHNAGVRSRDSAGFGQSVLETDVTVRSVRAYPKDVKP